MSLERKKRRIFLMGKLLVVVLVVLMGTLFITEATTKAQGLTPERRAELEAQLAKIEEEIRAQEAILKTKQRETTTIERDLAIIDAEIRAAQLEIKRRNIFIDQLGGQINQKTQTISQLDDKLGRSKESLAQLIRHTQKTDDITTIEIILSNDTLSNFFEQDDSFRAIQEALNRSFLEIRGIQVNTNEQRATLKASQREEIDARYVIQQKEKEIRRAEAEKQNLLNAAKKEEQTYETIIKQRESEAARIRSALFQLRDTAAIPFGEALDLAYAASAKTGVRPALVLAILEQESDFGSNIGSCYLRNVDTGAGVGKNTGTVFENVMKPTRDVAPFLEITERIGLDPFNTPVSCPIPGAGYGGAMGPSQFIPSTWKIFEDRIANAIGVPEANPWIPAHAVMATSIYLADLGADRGGYTAEVNAACRYYSGRVCDNRRPANTFYGQSVLKKAAAIQENIDFLEG